MPGGGGLVTMWRSMHAPSVSVVRRPSVIVITTMVNSVVHHLKERNVIKILMVMESVTMGL